MDRSESVEKEKKFKILNQKKIYLCVAIGICVVTLFLILLANGKEGELKPIAVYNLNNQGDYVGDNFRIEYNDKN